MNPSLSTPPEEDHGEILALIRTLHETGQRLEALTAGEVDTVVHGDGSTLMLPRSLERFRHSEAAKQAAIINALPATIALLDARGTILSVNEGWKQFALVNRLQAPEFGVGLDYLAICDQTTGTDAAEAHRAADGIRAVLGGGVDQFSVEYSCHSPNEQRWFLMTVTPLAKDRLNGAVVMHLDISARMRAEASWRESELRFSQMAENIRDAFFLLDADEKQMIYASPAFERIWGQPREALYANSELWLDAVHPEDRTVTLKAYAQTLKAGTGEFEFRVVRPDDSLRWVEVRAFPVVGDHGQIVRITGIAKDITTHKRDDQKFKDLLNAAPDAMVLVDHKGAMVLVNAAAIRIFGWTRPELLGQKIDKIVMGPIWHTHPTNLHGYFGQPMSRAMGDGNELFGLCKDGTKFPVEIRLSPLETDDGTLVMSAIRDVTERRQAAILLRESERRFSDMLENVELVSLMLDTKAQVTYCNDFLLRLTGWRREEVIGHDWFERFIPPEINHLRAELFQKILANNPDAMHDENDILTRSGERRLIRWKNSVLRSAEGAIIGTASIGEDITERKLAQEQIIFLNRVYAVLSGINTLIVRVSDRVELFREACRIAVEVGGFRMALIAMLDPSTLKVVPVASAGKNEKLLTEIKDLLGSSEDAPKSMTARAMKEKRVLVSNDSLNDLQVLLRDKYAEAEVCSMAVFPLIVENKAVGVLSLYAHEAGFFREEELKLLKELTNDIAFAIDHIDKQARLNYLAYYDVLTGLANRSLFLERLTQYLHSAMAGGHKLALFMIDLERFKNTNDSLGRPAGDELLRQVAMWLTAVAGDPNLVARVGADQFAVVLPEVRQRGNLAHMLEKMIAAFLQHPFHLNDEAFRAAARCGVSLFPDDGPDSDALFRNAEAALKRAKSRGERYLFYAPQLNEHVAGRVTLENQLRQALDNREFVLYYQPKVSLSTGRITSAEGLIRWNDPRTGVVPPGMFIPILEETGMIHDVGRWAVRQAIEDYLSWRNAGMTAVRLAVNISPLQLRSRGFIAEIREALQVDTRASDGLELEITESLIMDDVKHTIASLQSIRSMGVSVAIDDFGTGFSSLSYLASLPVDTLKIDRSFVTNMTEGPEGLSLVSTIINLAHSLKLKVVAEGVETEEQSRLLRLLNCEEMQGFLFSKPVPRDIFESKFLIRSAV